MIRSIQEMQDRSASGFDMHRVHRALPLKTSVPSHRVIYSLLMMLLPGSVDVQSLHAHAHTHSFSVYIACV